MAGSINIKGWKEYEKKLSEASNDLKLLADLGASTSADYIANRARNKAPLNDGNLIKSINQEGSNGVYKVNVSADYAAYVEFGTRRKVQIPAGLEDYAAQFKGSTGRSGEEAKKAIYEWCRKKGIAEDKWWAVYIGIMTKGIKAQPFLFPSVDEEEPKFFERLKKLLENL